MRGQGSCIRGKRTLDQNVTVAELFEGLLRVLENIEAAVAVNVPLLNSLGDFRRHCEL